MTKTANWDTKMQYKWKYTDPQYRYYNCFVIPVSSPERLQHPRPQGDALLQPVQQAQGAKEVRHPRPRGLRGPGHEQLQEQEPRVLAEHEVSKGHKSFFQSKIAISV